MIEVRLASEPVPGATANEDCAFAVPGLVGVLDGVTVLDGMETGCVHGPAWYARMLSGRLIRAHAADPAAPLDRLLATAIDGVRQAHGDRCDLTHPGTPASTVCLAKYGADRLEYLVLGDSPLVYQVHGDAGRVEVVDDQRVQEVGRLLPDPIPEDMPKDSSEYARAVRERTAAKLRYTNRPGGYWIASTDPAAAGHAVTGVLPLTGRDAVRRACLLTDGASRAVDTYDLYGWPELLDALAGHGPVHVIERVREAERAESGHVRVKRHDDASAVLITFGVS
ncbi:protein phosphatase 2C domain-containing protein [Rugosimonospora acidiphila]|uniref:Protein phosphatase 2C domain-containing protein n=1 Tax=Rugosimonospora acidiphila TaxID=556531 RepID=A0ABP9SK25_9ACTN